ncbi:16S rRNA (guanine(966)-N(2))-methyltransferase RsmD [uncultured Microbacterium sp.]|uniref:16S rRNA (guanine(966)-N(2))-methyltransferase RsmD n=1 Tax=uncultured Microbacterium sp. TaxID=191216 RepID=UPI00260C8FAE|nr:16S rRNA (guanine(966)-N(2))-methyltransferase RsmD [uncultured Microbacterium sp.]
MTRIIAGAARGVRLDVPGSGTRPTSDRVRESLFGALESMDALTGARALDLYAGSGALGLESLSRGAVSLDLVEKSRPAASVIRKNADAVAKAMGEASARVHESAVQTFLKRAESRWDLVFTDPPYDLSDDAMTGDLIALAPRLSPDAVVVIERGSRATPPDVSAAGLEIFREKTYGDTAMWWAQPVDESQSR